MNIKRPTPTQAMTRFAKDPSDKKLRSVRKAADSRKAVDSEKRNQTGSKSDSYKSFLERRAERLKLAKAQDASQLELREKAVDKDAKKAADARRRAYFAAKNKKAKDAADEEAKKITDGSFEVTEENFRLLVKGALLEALREMGASVEVDEQKEEDLIEPVETDAPEDEEDEVLEEDETLEDEGEILEDEEVKLTEILENPKKKDALRSLIADELKSSFKAIDNAPALFTHRYEQAAPAAKQDSPKIKNRYE